jgi:hypothetical protein
MSDHVNQWLNAYHDGELRARKQAQVEEHLAVCPECQAELEQLKQLSTVLQTAPLPQMSTSPEQFAIQVGKLLPRQSPQPAPVKRQFSWAWNLVPVGALAAIGFLQSVSMVAGLLTWIERLGISQQSVSWLLPEQPVSPSIIQQISSLALGWGLTFNTSIMVNLVLPLMLGAFYLLWLLIWWTNQEQGEQNQALNSLQV